jgi:hypothetical protein
MAHPFVVAVFHFVVAVSTVLGCQIRTGYK